MNSPPTTTELDPEIQGSIVQEIVKMGFRDERNIGLPNDATSAIFVSGDWSIAINKNDDGTYSIALRKNDGALPTEEGSVASADIVSTIQFMLGEAGKAYVAAHSIQHIQKVHTDGGEVGRDKPQVQSLTLEQSEYTSDGQRHVRARVTLFIEEQNESVQRVFEAEGEGPIHALCSAINKGVPDMPIEFDSLHISSRSSGYDAMGSATVGIRIRTKKYSGEHIGPDVVDATAHAYVAAINSALHS